MKKLNLIWIIGLILIFYNINVYSYLDCSPPSCPTGYQSNGTICEGSTCVTQCISYECTMQWTQVHSDTAVGWTSVNSAQEKDNSNSYNPTNTAQCYQFRYEGPSTSGSLINLVGLTNPSFDCDTEGIGGFLQGTTIPPGQSSNPWFNGMANYTGDVGGANAEYDYMAKMVRGHAEASVDSTYRIAMGSTSAGSIYCVPTNSISCNNLGGTNYCDNDCYNKDTESYVTQGYFKDEGTFDSTLYGDTECTGGTPPYAQSNRMEYAKFFVYSSPTVLSNITTETSCDRINEPPNATYVSVKPLNPNAGQDLECDFNYTDPENFAEQNSNYEWWKNSVNQNINSRILAKGNLTVGDTWYCKTTPSDGLLFGVQNQSTNTVTITTTVKNPKMVVNGLTAWNISGYYGWKEETLNFTQQLNNELTSCTPDANGVCDIKLTFTSDATGTLDLTDLEIFYIVNAPLISNFSIIKEANLSRIFEFIILNSVSTSNFNWILDTGDFNQINSIFQTPLNNSEDSFNYVEYNYTTSGNYTVVLTVTNGNVTDIKSLNITV